MSLSMTGFLSSQVTEHCQNRTHILMNCHMMDDRVSLIGVSLEGRFTVYIYDYIIDY